jgi:tight adherence protein C
MAAAFLGTVSLVLLTFLFLRGEKSRVDARLEELSEHGRSGDPNTMAQVAQSTLPKLGSALLPKSEAERTRLQTRLTHAGLYSKEALVVFLGVKLVLMTGPAIVGLVAGLLGLLPAQMGVLGGAFCGIVGMIGPSFWLDWMKRTRQASFRRAIPDALDVMVICLEGGLSLAAALNRVAQELRNVHPLLASELNIVQREVQLGRSEGEAMRQFAERSDLEEMRSLAAVITQAERYGAGLVKALRVHAEILRTRRMQYAEEMAQKAATKMLFPTVLFILPGIFIVVLGPAVIQIMDMLGGMNFSGGEGP